MRYNNRNMLGLYGRAEYSALEVAKYLIWKNKQVNKSDSRLALTPLKLQKILYYAQGWYLALYTKPLFQESLEAWKYGPVVREIYNEYKNYNASEIDQDIDEKNILLRDSAKKFLDDIWDTFKSYSGSELVNSTHSEKPWSFTYYESKLIISLDLMYEFFLRLKIERNV